MIALHVYKYYELVYPPSVWTMELLGLIMLGATSAVRIHIGYQANRTEGAAESAIFIMLTVPVCFTMVYFTTLTTYVLFIEVLISVIPLVLFSPLELLVSSIAVWMYWKN